VLCTFNELEGEKENAYKQLIELCEKNDWQIDGIPFTIIYDRHDNYVEFDFAFKTEHSLNTPKDFISGSIPSGLYVTVTHYGVLNNLPASYALIENWIQQNEYSINGNPFIIYINDANTEEDSTKLESQIFYPVLKNDI
jgi:effector-binding domain-containing protein